MAFGAEGIAMGTRFLMTSDSPVPLATKQRYLSCANPADIIVSRAIDGMPQRMVMNEMLGELERAGALKKLLIALRNGLAFRRHTGQGVLPSGQVAGVISDLPDCAELIARIVAEAEECLGALAARSK